VFREDALLKAGVIMIVVALALVLVAVVSAAPRSDPEQAVASEWATTTESSVESLIRGESPPEPWRESAKPLPRADVSKEESNPGRSGGAPKPETKPASEPEPKVLAEPLPKSQP
jgi:hypothetical protein